jgi:hypothetical protein
MQLMEHMSIFLDEKNPKSHPIEKNEYVNSFIIVAT